MYVKPSSAGASAVRLIDNSRRHSRQNANGHAVFGQLAAESFGWPLKTLAGQLAIAVTLGYRQDGEDDTLDVMQVQQKWICPAAGP